jgi:hypothetical protein
MRTRFSLTPMAKKWKVAKGINEMIIQYGFAHAFDATSGDFGKFEMSRYQALAKQLTLENCFMVYRDDFADNGKKDSVKTQQQGNTKFFRNWDLQKDLTTSIANRFHLSPKIAPPKNLRQ